MTWLILFLTESWLLTAGLPTDGWFCRVKESALSTIRTEDIYPVAEVLWRGDERTLEEFYQFWENRDTCDPR